MGSGKDLAKVAGIAALGATGLGAAGIGPLAGMMGAGGAGAGAAGATGGLGLLAPGASTAAAGGGLSIGGAGTGAGLGAASGLTPTAAMMGGNALLSPAITGGATGLPAMAGAGGMFANADPMRMGMMGAQMMNQGQQPQRPGMTPPPVMPMQGQGQPQQPFTGMSPYQLPGGLRLHSMNTAGMFRRG
jgi:hypothetical protein